ncbi:MAG: phage tail protein [Synechococcales bacterium]|nr:phage tail protein [Synechococcales bacterium]
MRTYPPVGFFFEVVFLGENLDKELVETRFQSVTGLTVELQTESLKEGGENRFEHTLPVRAKYSPLVLKRGVVKDSKMVKWCMDAIQNLDIRPMDLLVKLLHVRRENDKLPPSGIEPLMTWKVIRAWPQKWSVSEFDAEKNVLAIETLELTYSYFETLAR